MHNTNIINITNVEVAGQPVFIPNLVGKYEHHHLIVKVLKRSPIGLLLITVHIWGNMATKYSAHTIDLGCRLNLTGYFVCTTVTRSSGRKQLMSGFNVTEMSFINNEFVSELPEFNDTHLTIGKFGNARVWIRDHGFITQPTMFIRLQIL